MAWMESIPTEPPKFPHQAKDAKYINRPLSIASGLPTLEISQKIGTRYGRTLLAIDVGMTVGIEFPRENNMKFDRANFCVGAWWHSLDGSEQLLGKGNEVVVRGQSATITV